ncbi:unnamed protein product [Boreogadus saida]
MILRAFLPRGVPLRNPRYMEPHILGWRPLMLSMVYHCGTPRYMEPHILGWRPLMLRLIYFLFLRPSLMTSMW